ncbi:hypothetical protein C2R22_01670 [Salinigranum rubrum]|uniref:RING-type E3 ubiquitin transferase n=1 Tax=Salinigranum rubrum TaxID=755307 RepID=A0A2I8VF36_9EURY|nr:GIDE domain-containing protein [Salinigranum rubrum]AUV80525.1 hypothetical protein C2R22_01670 [Salinigranum rubrum]
MVFAPLVVVGLLPLVLALFVLVHVVRGFGDAAAVLRTRRVSVLSLAEGLDGSVALSGRARPTASGETLPAPLSGDEALVVEHEVAEQRSDGDGGRTWTRVDERRAAVPFVLDDGTAGVRVDPAAATLSLAPDEVCRVDADETVPAGLERLAADAGVDVDPRLLELGPLDIAVGRARRFTERCLHPGDDVTVVGTPTPDRGEVGSVNAVVASGDPFVVADAAPRTVAGRLAVEWGLHLAVAVLLGVVGGAVVYGGLVVA